MNRDWIVSLPVWGKDYVKRFVEHCYPSLSVALGAVHGNLRIILHTDAPELARLFRHYEVDVRPVDGSAHSAMSRAHRDAIAYAESGAAIAFLSADVICSRECFAAAERRFDQGYRAVLCSGTRTVGPLFGNKPPLGMAARELLEWSMAHAHPIVQQCFYPHGKNAIPSTLYFTDGTNIIMRAFHLHPFAVVKDRPLSFTQTIDSNLADCFTLAQTHVVTDADELALAEITPIGKRQALLPYAMNHQYIAWWLKKYGSERHREQFKARIVIRGGADTACDAPAQEILALT
jgi:hypothetical protein